MPPYLSDEALHSAFQRVKENHGCAGADGESLARFQSAVAGRLDWLRAMVHDGSYFALPLRKIEVQRHPGSEDRRTLLVPSVRDRVLQTAVATFLEPILEPEFEECSFAYRRGRSVRMAVERVHQLWSRGYTWLVDADIDHFFDNVDRSLVNARLATLVHDELACRLVQLWLDYSVWDGATITRPNLGLPQGSVISPMLANLCLDTLDDRLLEAGFQLVRYADDFVILTRNRHAAERAYALTEETLAQLRLCLHPGKTRLIRYSDGFRFLGVVFLKDMLLQPLRTGAPKLRVFSVAPPLGEANFPQSERRHLRQYRSL